MIVVGPLFRYELTRLARRGLQPWLRAVGVLVLDISGRACGRLFGLCRRE